MRTLLITLVVFAASACSLYFGPDSTPDHRLPDGGIWPSNDASHVYPDASVSGDGHVASPNDGGCGSGGSGGGNDGGIYPYPDANISFPDAH